MVITSNIKYNTIYSTYSLHHEMQRKVPNHSVSK